MTERAGGTPPTAVALDESLLDAKLSVPLPRPGGVSRGELIEAARASDCRVIGVTAPAGYGKSTLLVQWALAEDRRVAWVSLDRFDDDPAILLTVLASAYARVSPGNADLVADVGGLGVSLLGRAAPRLASVFRTSPVPFVLMLDDLHELRSPACHDVLEVVISGIPRGSQLIAASRAEQPHLPRLRASGDALEFQAPTWSLQLARSRARRHSGLLRPRARRAPPVGGDCETVSADPRTPSGSSPHAAHLRRAHLCHVSPQRRGSPGRDVTDGIDHPS